MLSWQKLLLQLQQLVNAFIRLVRARRREEAAIALAALLFWLGFYIIDKLAEDLPKFIKSKRSDLILYIAATISLCYAVYRIWRLVHGSELPPVANRPSAIKDPGAFTPADGELFRKLAREDDLQKLFGYIEGDQVPLIVLLGRLDNNDFDVS
jgi:hypothetical protein